MISIFTLWKSPCNIRNICLLGSEISRSVRFGVDAIAFHASHLRLTLPIEIIGSSSLEIFTVKIMLTAVGIANVTLL